MPLRQAHAHNDYQHLRPLFDALECGFTNIEADVILRNDTLYVAHDPEDVRPANTLESLYLEPLFELFKTQGNAIFPEWPTVYLMIDIKSHADSTFDVLHPTLLKYADMLTSWSADAKTERAVTVILSGNRPIRTVRSMSFRVVALDGRLDDLASNAPAHVFPWISENWAHLFSWRGYGEMSKSEQDKLSNLVQRAHRNNQLVRFWNTDSPSLQARMHMWHTLLRNDVDLINTDDLAGLARYMSAESKDKISLDKYHFSRKGE
jgi:hypothetical protein